MVSDAKGILPCEECAGSFCAKLPQHIRDSICSQKKFARTPSGTTKAAENRGDRFIIVRKGLAAVYTHNTDGATTGIMLCPSGHTLNISRVRCSGVEREWNNAHFCYAVSELETCSVSLSFVNDLIVQDAEFAACIIDQLIAQYQRGLVHASTIGTMSAEELIEWFFAEVSSYGFDANHMTHESISHVLGLSRVTVTRAMKRLIQRS